MASIELRDFLKWAFGEELVHIAKDNGSGGWNYIAAFAALGTVIDNKGMGPAPELSLVHPDAVAASDAVSLLAAERFDLPKGWRPFPDLDDPHGLIAQSVEDVLCRRAMRDEASLNANLIGMLISCSVLGKEPDWRVAQPAFRMVERSGMPAWFIEARQKDAFGRVYTYEADGFDARSRRPKPGAYRKFELSEPFQGAVQARIDWYLWAMALERVAERLQDGLKAHRIKPFRIDREIWKNPAHLQGISQGFEMIDGKI